MTDLKTSYFGEPAGAQARCGTSLPRRIIVVDDEMGNRQKSAAVLIRHETNSLVKIISITRKQKQAGNAAAECQL